MTAPDKDGAGSWGEAPQLRRLRLLITLLTATLIIGMGAIFALLAWRIAAEPITPSITTIGAESVAIPSGAEIIATGATTDALTIAIRDGEGEALLIFDPATGALIDRVAIARER
ncbi:MAG: DUF6476 family protein [Pseudomonadota bacterium]